MVRKSGTENEREIKGREFGRRLRFFRKRAGLNQEELALALGLKHKSSISHVESGRKGLTMDSIMKLEDILEVHPGILLSRRKMSEEDLLTLNQIIRSMEMRSPLYEAIKILAKEDSSRQKK